MSEADILQGILAARAQIDATLIQTISITFALIIAVYYFVHGSGLAIKISVLGLYVIGWLTFMFSGILTVNHLNALIVALSNYSDAEKISPAGLIILDSLQSTTATIFIVMANVVNFIVLFGVIALTFFWKKPQQ